MGRRAVSLQIHSTNAEAEQGDHAPRTWNRPALLLLASALVITAAWAFLLQWFSLFEHHATPKFSLDKIPGRFESTEVRTTAVLVALSAVAYVIGYLALLRVRHVPRWLIAVLAGLLAVALGTQVLLYPTGALDVFNYIMWLKLSYSYDLNPYVATFAQFEADPLRPWVFLHRVHLFYGPAWLLLTGPPLLLFGFGDVMTALVGLKLLNCALLLGTAWLIFDYRGGGRAGWTGAYLLLANPLMLWEAVGNAHNDLLMTTLIIAAALALQRASVLAGPLLMMAALVKLFAIVLAPLFVVAALRAGWPLRKIAVTLGLSLALAVALIAPFWAGGDMYDGFREALTTSQIYNSSSPYSLVREYLTERNYTEATVDLARRAFIGVFGLAVLALCWRVWRGRPVEPALLETLMLFLLCVSLLYPWYLIPLVAVVALRPSRMALVYVFAGTLLGLLYHPLSLWAWFNGHFSVMQVHLFEALLLAIPMLLFMAAELAQAAYLRWRGRQPTEAKVAARPEADPV